MNASVTARELARASLTRSIKDAARRQLAVEGAGRLSVRAVAREVGMVSSAVYRYFPTRDDLLTALIVDAYDALGEAVEAADASIARSKVRDRWRALSRAVRGWGSANRHEYALIYGSPIPDYQAPPETVGPAARVPVALMSLINDGWSIGAITEPVAPPLPVLLTAQLDAVTAVLALEVPVGVALRGVVIWTQLFGMVTFELFGQLVGALEPADEFFDAAVESMADYLGLSD
jgi:AcrR family transcriptional regulator